MTASVEARDVRYVDRLVNAIRAALERIAPWYDPAEAHFRRAETERVRRRSIAARIRAEKDIAARYRAADGAMRK
jgi:hypothetical protein